MAFLLRLALLLGISMPLVFGVNAFGVTANGKAMAATSDHAGHSLGHAVHQSSEKHAHQNCPREKANDGHAKGCCVMSCDAFQAIVTQPAGLLRLPVAIRLSSAVNPVEGLRPDNLYRPPEA